MSQRIYKQNNHEMVRKMVWSQKNFPCAGPMPYQSIQASSPLNTYVKTIILVITSVVITSFCVRMIYSFKNLVIDQGVYL